MNLEEYFPDKEVVHWKKLFSDFHGVQLIDSSLSDAEVLLISVYMQCNKRKTPAVNTSYIRNTFTDIGRKEDNFSPNLANLKRKDYLRQKTENDYNNITFTVEGLKKVKELLEKLQTDIHSTVIESGKVFSAKRILEERIISNIKNYLKICDPYCGVRILDILSEINIPCKISILTQNIEKEMEFIRELNDFRKEMKNIDIEIRRFSGNKLHDRYMITDTFCWSIGSSLKDLGNKDTIITRLDDSVRQAIDEIFELRWKTATLLT